MTTTTEGTPSTAVGRKPGFGGKYLDGITKPLVTAGEIIAYMGHVLWSAISRPVGYWADTRDQMYDTLRLCWIPVVVSCVAFGFGAPGLQGGNIYLLFGIPDRLGSFFLMASVREFAPWINAMIVAGVMGTAMTADLGARRIREEIDAMEVLGVDPIRTLIIPRVIAVTVMTALLDILALLCGVIGGFIASVYLGANPAAYVSNFFANATTPDIWGSVLKSVFFGLIIGIVCSFMGLRAKGGPAGVGKAVNVSVVTAFACIWVFNYVYTALLLGLNPEMQVFK
ncbi:ABC transporter permease [Pseudonocardia sp. ICBG1034]|uniref:MlaE family ABC transporter permease n=1 Tax=Pseudonocardia sp. ICBG1034 TaxID=2844381 RepID=UPI001CCCA61A|nr:ABC transporter permease [Pseudonocardia sp. ICBG1034]